MIESISTPDDELQQIQQEYAHHEEQRTSAAFNAVIEYMLGAGRWEEPLEFLRNWNEGNFDAIREEWPDAPVAIYYADVLADHDAIDAALSLQGAEQ